MADVSAVRESLTQVVQSTHVAMRCLSAGRDPHDFLLRALSLVTDILELLYRIKDEISSAEKKWFVAVGRLSALGELLEWFVSSMKSIELYFQPGGVSVFYFRKHLLEKTYIPMLEQYKIMFLLFSQPDSEQRSVLVRQVRNNLKKYRDLETANVKIDLNFEEAISTSSRLSSGNRTTLADLCNRRQQGTCLWLFENIGFKQWLLGGFRTLYCIGPPGAGKTFLSSAVIDYLQEAFISSNVAIVFIFCQQEGKKERTSMDILKTILAQLVFRKSKLSYTASSVFYSESLKEGSVSPKAYQNAIRAEINRFSKVFFVIDGLDTLSDKERILSRLQKLPQQTQLLVTLRGMSGIKSTGSSGYVSVLAPPEDIGTYTLARLQSDHGLQSMVGVKSPGLKNEKNLVHSVVEKSHGIFLLAKLHLDLLSQHNDHSILERVLVHLPENLSEAYGEAMKRIVSQSPHAAHYVYWVLYALGPLSVSELRSAVSDCGTLGKQESKEFVRSLVLQSAGLLKVDDMTGTVRFVHRTAKEYLEGSASRVFFPDAQKRVAEVCLTAISPDEIIDECYSHGSISYRTSKRGLANYAATYWGLHARQVDEEEQTTKVLMKAFLNKFLWRRPPLNYTTERAKNIPSELGIGNYPNDWSALHILSYIGITGNSKRLVDQGANINDQANQLGVSPLHCAAYQGNDEMVEFLLQNGAKVNEIAADGRTALHMATQNGHRGCIKLLFSGRANPQIVDQEGDSCLHIAVGTVTDESTVPLLVKHKVDVNFQNPKTGTTALHLAVEFRRPRIILFLLEKDAAINIANYDGLTALQLAANTDNCEAISLLLQRRALVEARSPAGPTALQYAAWKGYWVAFDLLIIGGANINVWNNQGETLLHEQSRYCTSLSVVSKLLEQGANIEARTSQGYTPLQCAALSGNKTIFNFLLDNGAKIDVETAKGENLLHITPPANQDCLDILKTTLNEGINASATSSQGWTPLHQTVHTGTGALDLTSDSTLEYIRLLLTHGASVNDSSASAVAETPLHLAAMAPNARSSLVEFLIRQGSNVQAVTGEEKTALHLAAESGRGPILRFLLEANGGLSFGLSTGNTAAVHAEKNETPVTALDLAKEDPSGSWSFDGSGRPSPKSQGSGRNSAMTIFEDIDSNVSESR